MASDLALEVLNEPDGSTIRKPHCARGPKIDEHETVPPGYWRRRVGKEQIGT